MYSLLSLVLPALLILSVQSADVVESTGGACLIKGQPGSYSYDPTSGIGPEQWGSIEGFETCGSGNSQSPIDFPTDTLFAPLADGPKPNISSGVFDFGASTSNWALSCAGDSGSCGSTMFGGKLFYVINTHFHAPSEHLLNGKQFPLEVHFVHASEDGDLAVIATMFDVVDDDAYAKIVHTNANKDFKTSNYFGDIMDNISSGSTSFPIANGDILRPDRGYCVYTGSLTTPPCSEGVTFFMSNHIETVSERQVFKYSISAGASFDGNNRPTQPLNGREITCYIL